LAIKENGMLTGQFEPEFPDHFQPKIAGQLDPEFGGQASAYSYNPLSL
jgi:hypothetical protein